ncbi:MAG: hypothetical protein CMB82_11640 [Flammeovirgaceae bacterium]|nr:hypothetical protein [Flammeovirgaceae bacterium]
MSSFRNYIVLLLFLFQLSTLGQGNIYEEVLLVTNKSQFLAGENIYFQGFVTSSKTGKLSDLSSLLYIELLDENQNPIYQTKLTLEQGLILGDLFISTLIKSGNYDLIAYTRWMKNRKDFHRVPISIYNPFENYTPPIITNSQMRFYAEGGKLVMGVSNKVVVRYSDYQEQGVSFKGKLVDDLGEKQADINSIDGLSQFSFIPEKGRIYQMIYTEGDSLKFLDLPMACENCSTIYMEEMPDSYSFQLKDNHVINQLNRALIRVRDRHNIYIEKSNDLQETLKIAKASLPNKLLRAEILDNQGEIMADRLFYNGVFSDLSEQELVSVPRGYIEFPVLDSNLSVSTMMVNKRSDQPRSLQLNQINSELISPPLQVKWTKNSDINTWLMFSEVAWPKIAKSNSFDYIPEYRNDLLQGFIKANGDQSVKNQIITFSVPGEEESLSLAKSDSAGRFLLNIEYIEGDREAYISVLNDDTNLFEIKIEDEFYTEYPKFKKWPLYYDSLLVKDIVVNSIHLQVENAYHHLKKDRPLALKEMEKKKINFRTFNVDDYTRFPTVRDSFIEYIPEIGVSKSDNDYAFEIRWPESLKGYRPTGLYLILFDGVVASPQEVLSYSPYNIKTIKILAERYYMGPAKLDGLIYFTTMDEDLYGFEPHGVNYFYKGMERQKQYYTPNHKDSQGMRIPDRRTMLLFQAKNRSDLNTKYELFTSDILGEYEVMLMGLSPFGELIQEIRTLVVE